ncbi:MAG: type 2 isopentenyl-diphosphate Delta-isomerase [Aeriscardovia sp.]|nr:type 2 isopentenyl-diphosphate Delta-isomerase [Aeriscardovia sp.]
MNEEAQSAAARKKDHIVLARHSKRPERNDFDKIFLVRPALPESKADLSNAECGFFGFRVKAPFFINAMTGGVEEGDCINRDLCRASGKNGIPMAFGSASFVEQDPSALKGFEEARDLTNQPVLVNVNADTSPKTVKTLVKALDPIALQIHVNAVQELVMPEGSREWKWKEKIARLRDAAEIPVIVKEVGFGFDVASIKALAEMGVDAVDVSGKGGTNFCTIENCRREKGDFSYLAECGFSTVQSLLNARFAQQLLALPEEGAGAKMPEVISSGGIRNPLDVLKSLALGARWVGVSGKFLSTLLGGGEEALEEEICEWKEQLSGLIALYGASSPEECRKIPWICDAELESYAKQMARLVSPGEV